MCDGMKVESTEVEIHTHPRKGVAGSSQQRPSPPQAENRGAGVRTTLGELLPWSVATEQLLDILVINSGKKAWGWHVWGQQGLPRSPSHCKGHGTDTQKNTTHTHTHAHTRTRTHTRMHTHGHTHTCTQAHAHFIYRSLPSLPEHPPSSSHPHRMKARRAGGTFIQSLVCQNRQDFGEGP